MNSARTLSWSVATVVFVLLGAVTSASRAAQAANRQAGAGAGTGAVETQLEGEFKGWEGQTTVKLVDGQIWQQIEYHYEYHYAYMPKVLIYSSGGGYKMRVDGTSKPIGVQRLR